MIKEITKCSCEKALFVPEMITLLCFLVFGHVEKRLDKKAKINFKIYDVTDWTTNYYNTHITQYLKRKDDQAMKFDQLIE